MGWNGSDRRGNSAPVQPKVTAKKKPSPIRGLIAGFVVVAAAVGCYFAFFTDSAKSSDEKAERNRKIKEVSPAKGKNGVATAKADVGGRGDGAKDVAKTNVDKVAGVAKKAAYQPPVITNRIVMQKARFEVFKHPSETHLAFLTCAPLGTMMIGDFDYDEEFIKDLKESMKEQIVINPDDEEDVKQYKEAVIAVKKELKAMMDRGEDVAKALAESRKELQEMGVYKAQLDMEMTKIRTEKGDDLTPGDLEDLVGAVNKMLEEKGIEPFGFSKLTGTIYQRKAFASPEEAAQEEAELAEAEQAAKEEIEAQKEAINE